MCYAAPPTLHRNKMGTSSSRSPVLITSEDQGPVDLIVSTSEVSQDPSRLVAQSHLQPVQLEKQVSVSVLNFSTLYYFFIEVCTAPQSI